MQLLNKMILFWNQVLGFGLRKLTICAHHRLQMLLEEVDLWSFVEGKATVPTDPVEWDEHNKRVAKAKRIIMIF
jgi:hypothetical protein